MVGIDISKMADAPEGPPCIVYNPNDRCQEFHGELDDEDSPTRKLSTHIDTTTNTEMEEFYDPEMDSPSSWTTQSSHEEATCCRPLLNWRNAETAMLARIFSNVFLALITVAGIVYGALLRFAADNNKESIGVAMMFGSAVGGAIALILMNLSWCYRRKNDELTIRPPCFSSLELACPVAQLSGSLIVLLTGAILVPAYHQNTNAILVLVFGILLPLLILINLPMLFDEIRNIDDEDEAGQSGQKGLEVLPGSTLDCHTEPTGIKVRKHKELPFFKL
jgi:hypothetical protein